MGPEVDEAGKIGEHAAFGNIKLLVTLLKSLDPALSSFRR